MDSATFDDAVSDLTARIQTFLDEFERRDVSTARITAIIENGDELKGSDIHQQPERFIEDHLVFPTLEVLGYDVTPRPNSIAAGEDDEYPDLRVDNLSESVIGENKSLNDLRTARTELLAYLNAEQHAYGFATDGFEWGIYGIKVDGSGDLKLDPIIPQQNLRPVIQYYARERELVAYNDDLTHETNPQKELATFFKTFGHHNIRAEISGLTHFHDKYAEMLAGEGEYGHEGIQTSLLETISAPAGASEGDRLAFAALLVDRLAFVRLMEDRGVLDVRLRAEWEEHDHGLNRFRGSFLKNHLHELFYEVLAVPPPGRADVDAFGHPPHFAGGLFEPVLPNEREYDIADEAMRDVLTAFIEGEVRTVINEAVHGSLLQSYRGSGEAALAGRMAEWYGEITDRYEDELRYVEEHIRPTLRGFSGR